MAATTRSISLTPHNQSLGIRPPEFTLPNTAIGLENTKQWAPTLYDSLQKPAHLVYIPRSELEVNQSNIGCPTLTACQLRVSVPEVNALEINYMHANCVDLGNTRYIAGQSPDVRRAQSTQPAHISPLIRTRPIAAYEKLIIQGIVSGNGVFQFVSPKAHRGESLRER
jgi:hypothetical protein